MPNVSLAEGCIFGLFCAQVALVAEHEVVSIGVCEVQGVAFTRPVVTLALSVGDTASSAFCSCGKRTRSLRKRPVTPARRQPALICRLRTFPYVYLFSAWSSPVPDPTLPLPRGSIGSASNSPSLLRTTGVNGKDMERTRWPERF